MATRPKTDNVLDAAKPHVLVIDDEDAIRRTLKLCLDGAGYQVALAASGEAGLTAARRHPPDLVLVDLRLGGIDGLEVTRRLRQDVPNAAVIVMTAYATIDNAVEAMRAGASDYIAKPFTPASVKHVVSRVLETHRLYDKLREVERGATVVLKSDVPAVKQAYALAERAAATDTTVLILGETGTGKGVLARHIHQSSARAERPFVTINCATISPQLIENELFGHARGAFTGADQARAGYVEAAKNGTLFVDEVGDLGKELQGKLLRLLEEREYVRIGDTEPRRSDARIVAATHIDLKEATAKGAFRDDLFYRLNVVTIHLPPLRERREDIPRLINALLPALSRKGGRAIEVSAEAMNALVNYDWPGNIRELSNVLERALLLGNGETLTADLLPEETRATLPAAALSANDESLEAAERRHLAAVLARYPTLDAAAKALHIDPSTLYRKRERYGLL